MAIERQETQNQIDWRRMHALGLPAGSVRALLAVLVFATVWGMLLVRPSQEVPDYLSDLMFVIMGHYFATRKRNEAVAVPGDEPGPPPLFLPTGSIRLLLAGGSAAVAVVLYQRGVLTRIDRNPGVTTLLLVGGFLIGVILNALIGWWRARQAQAQGHRGHASLGRHGGWGGAGRLGLEPDVPRRPARPSRRHLQPLGPPRPTRPGAPTGGGHRVLLRFAVVTHHLPVGPFGS